MMKSIKYILVSLVVAGSITACQDKDYEIADPVLAPIPAESITGSLQGDDYVWSWSGISNSMQVAVYNGTTLSSSEVVSGSTYTHKNIDTNIEYTYVFKLTDGTNLSSGVVKHYLRPGAAKISGVSMAQVEKAGGYDAKIEWNRNETATSIKLTATDGSRNISETLAGDATSYLIPNVNYGEEWNVTLVAQNNEGTSLPVSGALRIGKTAIGFLSIYPTESELISNGDDDEASAWLWLKSEYPTAEYVYFGDIKSVADIDPFRVLFWLRDLEGVGEDEIWNMPQVVMDATPVVSEWYAAGGNLLLWSHATPYIGTLGRLDSEMLRNNDHSFGTGFGGWNGDTWMMAVQIHPGSRFKKDFSSHPIYKGLETVENDRVKLIPFKGPGWTEDHNCLYFNIPSVLTGIGNQEETCYNVATQEYGIYPLGTWDSQIDWVSQLNVWEAQQGNTQYKGTVLCIGNGGCEFSMRNADGTPDISAYPSNNIYQDNVLTLAKNSLEYLKTR
ncbi:MAG: DUF4960 domain-containing protein [Muribaculum sp.]|nr:DUF4960 domain-containing protein [Muribaculum sp.]